VTTTVFGSEARVRRPAVLIVVFGVLLVLVGVTATAQAMMVSTYASTSTVASIVDGDVGTIRSLVADRLDGFDPANPDPDSLAELDAALAALLANGGLAHVELRAPDGTVLAASEPSLVGRVQPADAGFTTAIAGQPWVGIDEGASAGLEGVTLPATVITEHLPLRQGDTTRLVVSLWRDAAPMLARLDDLRRDVVLVTLTAALVAGGVLFAVFRSAQRRISRQTEALVSANRLDALTGLLNHGAIVAHLAREVEQALTTPAPLGVALLDIDNFRSLNDTHDHRAGDDVLLLVTDTIREDLPEGITVGRYGPDEFLLVATGDAVGALEATVERVCEALRGVAIEFDGEERLPVTVSGALCRFPDHGHSVTDLLATVASTLQEAKASGGDRVVVADGEVREGPALNSFDVFQGLILAIDSKDRYTKRHSEDVARYGEFLGRRLGLDEDTLRTVRVAGLLHDVGKIGIPDALLRKAGKLTAEELEVVKQHVVLGDLIVRDLPDLDAVRAGVRHHHERWDGEGYLHGLAGEAIPQIARILAVADAFSAMTTTRPYRKALDVREALLRLADASDTQLEARLVEAFIRGIETAPDAPLPGNDAGKSAVWTPGRKVA
jgi:diguanylate cyclase (GGDEF)-like protein